MSSYRIQLCNSNIEYNSFIHSLHISLLSDRRKKDWKKKIVGLLLLRHSMFSALCIECGFNRSVEIWGPSISVWFLGLYCSNLMSSDNNFLICKINFLDSLTILSCVLGAIPLWLVSSLAMKSYTITHRCIFITR